MSRDESEADRGEVEPEQHDTSTGEELVTVRLRANEALVVGTTLRMLARKAERATGAAMSRVGDQLVAAARVA